MTPSKEIPVSGERCKHCKRFVRQTPSNWEWRYVHATDGTVYCYEHSDVKGSRAEPSPTQRAPRCRNCPCDESDHGGEHKLCANCPLCQGFAPATQRAPEAKISLTEAVRIARESYQLKPPSVPIRFDGDEPATQREEASRDTQPKPWGCRICNEYFATVEELCDHCHVGEEHTACPGPSLPTEQHDYVMSPAEREEQRRSFAHGNVALHNPDVTREVIDRAADKLAALPTEAPRVERPAKRKKATHVGAPACFALELACQHINAALGGYGCYVVGSALERADWRDVDVRYILGDEEFDALFPDAAERCWEHDPRWLLLTVSISAWLSKQTGLPIDFQIQPQTHANERHKGPRNAAGIRIARAATPRPRDDAKEPK